ncbi:DUF433 domain-containing protein [Glycomyces sp. NPDC048151]|uniref:DUF433 domain-containing protein n=1 Tax=Glycomyces sp. NPDC048151 TaxID=3364002 RepID=UPI00372391CB
MKPEPTRAEEIIGPDTRCPCGQSAEGHPSGYCSYDCFNDFEMGGRPAEAPRPPAVEPVAAPAAEIRGTGDRNPHARPEAVEYCCPQCDRWAEWTDGLQASDGEDLDEFWCQTCGAQTSLDDMDSRPALIPAALVESHPGIRGGEPVMRGTRVPAADVAGLLHDGLPWSNIHEYYPSIPVPEGTMCTGRQCDCFADRTTAALEPAAAAVFKALCGFNSDYAHGYDNADEMAVLAADAARPVHLREAADSLDQIADAATAQTPEWWAGVAYAATLLRHTADDLDDALTDTEGTHQ